MFQTTTLRALMGESSMEMFNLFNCHVWVPEGAQNWWCHPILMIYFRNFISRIDDESMSYLPGKQRQRIVVRKVSYFWATAYPCWRSQNRSEVCRKILKNYQWSRFPRFPFIVQAMTTGQNQVSKYSSNDRIIPYERCPKTLRHPLPLIVSIKVPIY
jgi:hypothetical protein